MTRIPYRTLLTLLCLGFTLIASVIYDFLAVQDQPQVRLLLAAGIAACMALIVALTRFPLSVLQRALVAAWPLHLFTLSFVWICIAFHGGAELRQVIMYSLFGYATYLLLPMVFVIDHRVWNIFVKWVALLSAALAIPSFWGAIGLSSFFGLPLRLKHSYANFSGIIASAGLFEHAEGHAFQMAIGMVCSWYAIRRGGRIGIYTVCLVMTTLGLVISQGRASIFGIGIVVLLGLLPPLFRHSRILLFSTLAVTLCFPFLILPQLKQIPVLGSYLRIERGLSGREEAWRFALTAITEKPWTGHGFMASTQFTEEEHQTLRRSGFSGAGTTFHNTYITKSVDLGLIVTGIYTLLYLIPLSRICAPTTYEHDQTLIRNMLILALTASIFRDYNVGGIRSTTMLGTLFFGMANLWLIISNGNWNWFHTYGASRVDKSSAQPEPLVPDFPVSVSSS